MPALKRNTASSAPAVRMSDATRRLPGTGTSSVTPGSRISFSCANSTCSANQMARLRITPTTAAVIAASAPPSARLPRKRLDERRAEEDPEEAGHEGHPGGEHAAERAGDHGMQRARIPKGAHEADELHDHDQRAGRGLGQAQAIQHLAGLEPAVGLDRLLRDVGQHGVGAAEGDDRHLAEEHRDPG